MQNLFLSLCEPMQAQKCETKLHLVPCLLSRKLLCQPLSQLVWQHHLLSCQLFHFGWTLLCVHCFLAPTFAWSQMVSLDLISRHPRGDLVPSWNLKPCQIPRFRLARAYIGSKCAQLVSIFELSIANLCAGPPWLPTAKPSSAQEVSDFSQPRLLNKSRPIYQSRFHQLSFHSLPQRYQLFSLRPIQPARAAS